jgi:hypothetical protein
MTLFPCGYFIRAAGTSGMMVCEPVSAFSFPSFLSNLSTPGD